MPNDEMSDEYGMTNSQYLDGIPGHYMRPDFVIRPYPCHLSRARAISLAGWRSAAIQCARGISLTASWDARISVWPAFGWQSRAR
jgi:hypothetical protein